jgi:hypothetical protein
MHVERLKVIRGLVQTSLDSQEKSPNVLLFLIGRGEDDDVDENERDGDCDDDVGKDDDDDDVGEDGDDDNVDEDGGDGVNFFISNLGISLKSTLHSSSIRSFHFSFSKII